MICATCGTTTPDTPCTHCGNNALLIGKYRLERELGRGAQGTTFLAAGPTGTVAIKELQLGRAGATKRAELIQREADVLSQVSHPQIPSVHEHFVDGLGVARSLYVVQDFISGESLEARLAKHRFTEVEVVNIVLQVAGILKALHGLSPAVIHRDIKPSNLMIGDDGRITLIDFGAVRDVMRDTVGGGSTVAGTFGYMPPEQLVGDATPASDIYALGMTAVRLLTRQQPTALADRTGRLSWRTHANVSETVAGWLDAMLQHDPRKRPSAVDCQTGPVAVPTPRSPSTVPTDSAAQQKLSSPVTVEPVSTMTLGSTLSHYNVQELVNLAHTHGLLLSDVAVRERDGRPGAFDVFDRNLANLNGQESWMRVDPHPAGSRIAIRPPIHDGYGLIVAGLFLGVPLALGVPQWLLATYPPGSLAVTGPLSAGLAIASIAICILALSGGHHHLQKRRTNAIDAFQKQAEARWGAVDVAPSEPQDRLPAEAVREGLDSSSNAEPSPTLQ